MHKPYSYLMVREDIPLEHQMVQLGHAALEAGFSFNRPAETSYLILLAAKNQEELVRTAEELADLGIEHHMFYEPDFGPMGHSALATRPLFGDERKHMRKYRLYKAKQPMMETC
ncbi:TonB-dependent receptor [Novimethylophilus kurashikiensis]|uniref:TonB-dependent receptor n=1 Tax=Novimethylophilus kurashikiensis TaxID=1825523 RepID=A0A2R5F933_9PROT|nr:hypothetical protein [Novimethylophilus kurashikiensis]GBG14329.1 TonB-dependent receptor [Novimethylophilus kurashikiensis]